MDATSPTVETPAKAPDVTSPPPAARPATQPPDGQQQLAELQQRCMRIRSRAGAGVSAPAAGAAMKCEI